MLAQLIAANLSESSLSTYRRAWRVFHEFSILILKQTEHFPTTTDNLALFIAYLANKNYAASTVLTYVSALGYAHRLASLPDPSRSELIQLALRGYSKMNPILDSRLPITLPILERLISALDHSLSSQYQRVLMKAMCACAFFAALRVGEITCRPGESVNNLINLEQIFEMRNRRGVVEAIKLSLIHFKHSDTLHPVDILIYRDNPVCPVSLLSTFLQLRGSSRGPLFSWPNNQAISRSFFTNCLNQTLDFCGLDRSRYKSHSFRIGAASWAAAKGLSDAQIRTFGRWKSNAFLRYIRTSTIKLS